jgi:hypothetical protein
MTLESPKYAGSHPDRPLNCQETVEVDLLELIDKANMLGWGTLETMDAIVEVITHLRVAYEEDPNPADEPIMDARLFLHKHPE